MTTHPVFFELGAKPSLMILAADPQAMKHQSLGASTTARRHPAVVRGVSSNWELIADDRST
ncbi:hypothetical protein GCM10027262_06850 [Nocardia tengchongensis]